MKYSKPLIVVTLIVLLGEFIANLIAEYKATFTGIGVAILAALVVVSVLRSKSARP